MATLSKVNWDGGQGWRQRDNREPEVPVTEKGERADKPAV